MKSFGLSRTLAAAGIALVLTALPAQAQWIDELRTSKLGPQSTAQADSSAVIVLPQEGGARRGSQWQRYALIGAGIGVGLVVARVAFWCAVETKIGCENDDTIVPVLVLAVPAAALGGGALGAVIGYFTPATGSDP